MKRLTPNIRIDTTRRGAWPHERKLAWMVPLGIAVGLLVLALTFVALVLTR
jgi:hypothetical protein